MNNLKNGMLDIPELRQELRSMIKECFDETVIGQQQKDWLTEKEARAYLGVSKSTLHNWRKDGVLPFSQFKGKIYYRYTDICDFLDENNTHSKRRGGRHV